MGTDVVARGSWRVYEDKRLPRPLAAALSTFVEHGYHGTSIRDIASRAGLSVPGLYHYYPSKQALLVGLTNAVMSELLEHSRQAEAEVGPAPQERFAAVVESLLLFHMHRRDQSFVAATEIRSMEPESRGAYIAQRDEQQRMLDRIVLDGVQQGVFSAPYPEDASRAVASMCVALANWYRPDGSLSPNELVARYLQIAQSMVGASAVPRRDCPRGAA